MNEESNNRQHPLRQPGRIELRSLQEARRVSQTLAGQARHLLRLFSADLDAAVYDQADFLSAVKSLALRSRFSRIQILLEDNRRVQREGHRLVELSRRLPTHIAIRHPNPDYVDQAYCFLLADSTGYMRTRQAGAYQGEASLDDRTETTRLGLIFDRIWERSEPDSGLRQLDI